MFDSLVTLALAIRLTLSRFSLFVQLMQIPPDGNSIEVRMYFDSLIMDLPSQVQYCPVIANSCTRLKVGSILSFFYHHPLSQITSITCGYKIEIALRFVWFRGDNHVTHSFDVSTLLGKEKKLRIFQGKRRGDQSSLLTFVRENRFINHLQFSRTFPMNIYFCEQSQEGRKLTLYN